MKVDTQYPRKSADAIEARLRTWGPADSCLELKRLLNNHEELRKMDDSIQDPCHTGVINIEELPRTARLTHDQERLIYRYGEVDTAGSWGDLSPVWTVDDFYEALVGPDLKLMPLTEWCTQIIDVIRSR